LSEARDGFRGLLSPGPHRQPRWIWAHRRRHPLCHAVVWIVGILSPGPIDRGQTVLPHWFSSDCLL